jgi:hypothetical protein
VFGRGTLVEDRVVVGRGVELLLVVVLVVERDSLLFLVAERVRARDTDVFRLVVLRTLRLLRLEFLEVVPLRPLT